MFSPALPLLLLLSVWGSFGSVSGSAAVEEAYRDVVSVVSPGQRFLTEEALRSLFNTLEKRVQCGEVPCGKCDLSAAVHQLFGNHSLHTDDKAGKGGENVSVSVSQFPDLAAGSVLYLSSPDVVCAAIKEGKWGEKTEQFLHSVTHHDHHEHANREEHAHDHNHMDVHGLETVFVGLRHHYEPSPNETCLTPGDIVAEVNASAGHQKVEVGAALGRVLYHALLGRCFTDKVLPEEKFFLDYIINQIGSENFTIEALEALMKTMKLGALEDDHDHGHDHGHGHSHADHDEHDDHNSQRRRKRSSHEHHEAHDSNSTWEHRCFTAEELVLIYGLPEDGSSALGRSDVSRLSPAFIQQILSGACTQVPEPTIPDSLSETEKYLYATLANVLITLTSMFGIVILLFTSCTSAFQFCIQFCISLAVGSLTGDALLHLLPMFLGLHVHSHEDGGSHDHEEVPDYLYKLLVAVAAIYLFYLMESIFSLITHKDHHHHHHHHHHQHDHGNDSDPHHCDHGRVLEMFRKERKEKNKSQSTSKADLVDCENDTTVGVKEQTRSLRMLPLMITIGDGIHNFADGLAMGAAFSVSWRSGLATSLAVFCHELPHELGDFAILLHSGLSIRKALLLNVGSAMTSFVGLYIALSVATDLATQQWIAAVTAGLFLYVGLADMLPTLIHINSKTPWLMFALQNAGILTGWGILLLLSLYEGSLLSTGQ